MTFDDNNLPPSDAARVTEPTAAPEQPATPITPGYLAPIDPLLPEDLRVPWGWIELMILVAVAVLGSVVVTLLLVGGFAAAGIGFRQVQNSAGDRNLFLIVNQALLSVVLLAYLATQMRHRFHAPFWRTIGWRPLQTGQTPRAAAYLGLIFSGCVLAILVSVSSAALKSNTQMPIEQFFQDRRRALC